MANLAHPPRTLFAVIPSGGMFAVTATKDGRVYAIVSRHVTRASAQQAAMSARLIYARLGEPTESEE